MKKKTMMGKLSSLLFALALVWGGVACTQPETPAPTTYTITFDSGVESISVEEGAVAKEPAKPTKDGYTFVEWLNGETAYDWTAPVTGNLTLTAKWAVEKYTIDYKLPEGSTNDESNLVEYTIESETISELKDPKLPEGFTFLGWYTDENCTEEFVSIEKGSTGDVVIYAKYTDKQTFTVTYYIGDKANTKLEEKDAVFTLTGYDLFTDKECTKAYKDPITSDITLYARVKKMTVKFDSNGGSAVAEAKVDYNTAVAKPTDPTLAGSTFQGWTLDGKAYDFNAKVTKDITLKATWKENAAKEPEDPADPTIPTIPTTVAVTKNEDGSFSFADGTYTFVSDGTNPVLKFSMPEEVSCTIGDKLKLTGKINFGDTAVYKQFYIQTNDTAGVPLFGYNMLTEWTNGLSGDQTLSLSQTIPDKIGDVTYCTSFKDCKFVLSAPIIAGETPLINIELKDVVITYEIPDPNAEEVIFDTPQEKPGNVDFTINQAKFDEYIATGKKTIVFTVKNTADASRGGWGCLAFASQETTGEWTCHNIVNNTDLGTNEHGQISFASLDAGATAEKELSIELLKKAVTDFGETNQLFLQTSNGVILQSIKIK